MDESDAIIVTFHQQWRAPLLAGEIDVVFRKLGPRDFVPRLLYAYVSAPISAIIARAPIEAYHDLPLTEALRLSDRGAIEKEELRQYAAGWLRLIVMELGQISVASTPLSCKSLSAKYNYWPSSTFIPLSRTGVQTLDQLGQFRLVQKKQRHA